MVWDSYIIMTNGSDLTGYASIEPGITDPTVENSITFETNDERDLGSIQYVMAVKFPNGDTNVDRRFYGRVLNPNVTLTPIASIDDVVFVVGVDEAKITSFQGFWANA